MEITPGVHRIDGITGSNSVLLVDDHIAVIDTGISGNGEAIVSYIRKIGRSPKDLRWIIVTHYHFDHSGSALELHELTGADIVAHTDETELGENGKLLLRKGNEDSEPPPRLYSWIMARGNRSLSRNGIYADTEVHQTVEDGHMIPILGGMRILHTPGHTPGSICPVLEGPQVLFLGDSAINNINRLSRPLTWDRNKRRQLDKSLYKLRNLEATIACFGHGPPLTDEVMDRVRGMTDRPYDKPTWQIALKNWRTLVRWQRNTRRKGHLDGGGR
jgi:glyoxylase-like metal-dependent hydrolase (beta-lactamase superfamily II)